MASGRNDDAPETHHRTATLPRSLSRLEPVENALSSADVRTSPWRCLVHAERRYVRGLSGRSSTIRGRSERRRPRAVPHAAMPGCRSHEARARSQDPVAAHLLSRTKTKLLAGTLLGIPVRRTIKVQPCRSRLAQAARPRLCRCLPCSAPAAPDDSGGLTGQRRPDSRVPHMTTYDALPDRAGRASNRAVPLEWFRGSGSAGPDRHGSAFFVGTACATHAGAAP
jgi:hypothetical protein